MDIHNVSFDFVMAYPIVRARLERAHLPWLIYLVQVSFELLTSAECLATNTFPAGLRPARRAHAPRSIDGLDIDGEDFKVRGFRWGELWPITGG
jgi:hypothetical protein